MTLSPEFGKPRRQPGNAGRQSGSSPINEIGLIRYLREHALASQTA
jgi:hypothetical protein